MSFVALYRKYRPHDFSSIVGQETTVKILKNSIEFKHIGHAYLFAGPRGTGKTSIAKIFAQAVNCLDFKGDICGKCSVCEAIKENDSDIIEIDAASNNGVDEIRILRDNVKIMPSFCQYKVYIIDEVHMLSTGAFNALLKTLEEPPSHVIFILATTEPNKIPLTILSRCQRFDFKPVESAKIASRLNYILKQENELLTQDIVDYISSITDGCMRDAINLLDQTLLLGKGENTTIEDINTLSGKISLDYIFNLLINIINNNTAQVLDSINTFSEQGKSFSDLVTKLLNIIRDIAINYELNNYFDNIYSKKLSSVKISLNNLQFFSKTLNELYREIKYSNDPKTLFEIYILQFMNKIKDTDVYLENEINNTKESIKEKIIEKETPKVQVETTKFPQEEKIAEKSENGENIEKSKEVKSNNNSIKKARINNVLAEANKSILNKVTVDFANINDYLSNKKYNNYVNLLNESTIVVASPSHLLFSFGDKANISVFDNNLEEIQRFLTEILGNNYKIAAVTEKEWLDIKNEFIYKKNNNIKYSLIDENDVKLEIRDNNNKKAKKNGNPNDIFGESLISIE